jgi:hypothetical protein
LSESGFAHADGSRSPSRRPSEPPLGQRGAVVDWRRSGSFHKFGTCQASAAAQGDRQGQQRGMPSGKIVPRSSWSTGTASRRARSRRACGLGCTCGISLRRLRPPKPRLALTTPARPSSGCGRDERGGERGRRLNPDTFPSIAYRFKFAVLVRGDVDGGQGRTAPAAVVESLRGKSCWIERQGGAC